jgi:hypothetical protein
LGFRLEAEGTMLRLIDARTGEPIPTRAEAAQRANQVAETERQRAETERQRASTERQRADTLAAEVERLKALLGGDRL